MSLQVSKETGVVYDPVFLKILEDIPGGVTLKTNRFPTATKEIKKGALLNADATTAGLYNLIKTAKVIHTVAINTNLMYWDPRHEFKVGEYVNYGAASAASIVSITESGVVSVAVVLAHTLGIAIPNAAVLYEAASSGTTLARYAASAILRDTVEVRRDGVTTLLDNVFAAGVVRGTVDESELPYFVTAVDKTALTARIRFAQNK